MKPYANYRGNSGVVEFEITDDSIKVLFKRGKRTYVYSNVVTGTHHVDAMKEFAESGRGLSTYIAQHKKELAFN